MAACDVSSRLCPLLVQNTVVEDLQPLPWRLCYARDKAQPAPSAAASAGADALQVHARYEAPHRARSALETPKTLRDENAFLGDC